MWEIQEQNQGTETGALESTVANVHGGNQGIDTGAYGRTLGNLPSNANLPDLRSGRETSVKYKRPQQPCTSIIQGKCPTGARGPCSANSLAAPASMTSCQNSREKSEEIQKG